MARVAVVVVDDDDVRDRVERVMAGYGAELVHINRHPNSAPQLEFRLPPEVDVDRLNSDLDLQCGAGNYRGKVCGYD